jgi:hypothetical protein
MRPSFRSNQPGIVAVELEFDVAREFGVRGNFQLVVVWPRLDGGRSLIVRCLPLEHLSELGL